MIDLSSYGHEPSSSINELPPEGVWVLPEIWVGSSMVEVALAFKMPPPCLLSTDAKSTHLT